MKWRFSIRVFSGEFNPFRIQANDHWLTWRYERVTATSIQVVMALYFVSGKSWRIFFFWGSFRSVSLIAQHRLSVGEFPVQRSRVAKRRNSFHLKKNNTWITIAANYFSKRKCIQAVRQSRASKWSNDDPKSVPVSHFVVLGTKWYAQQWRNRERGKVTTLT